MSRPTGPSSLKDAVSSAGKTLGELMDIFADVGQGEGLELVDVVPESSGSPDLELPIEALDLSERPRNCLRRAQIKTVGELVESAPPTTCSTSPTSVRRASMR